MNDFNLNKLRREFPILSRRLSGGLLTYFDSAATMQTPRRVIDLLAKQYQKHYANVHRATHDLASESTASFEQARVEIAQFIDADPDEVIWTRGTTEAINLVARTWGDQNLCAGDEILLSSAEHHANIVPWQMLAERSGAVVVFADLCDDGSIDVEHWCSLLNQNTKLVAITHASNATGAITPLQDLIPRAKAMGATVLVDGAQAVAHLPVSVRDLGCDFYAFSGHKLYGPNGIGVLWGRSDILDSMPAFLGGGEMIVSVDKQGFKTKSAPLKFEPGTPPWPEAVALAEAVRWLNQYRDAGALTYESEIYSYLCERVDALDGFNRLAQHHPNVGVCSLTSDHAVQDLGEYLNSLGIAVRVGNHCAQPLMQSLAVKGTLRISLGIYNTREEIDRLVEALEAWGALTAEPARETTDNLGDFKALMLMGQTVEPLAAEKRTSDTRVEGCDTAIWLEVTPSGDRVVLSYAAESQSMMGLLAFIERSVIGLSRAELSDYDLNQQLIDAGLQRFVTQSRRNGLEMIVERIKKAAK